MALTVSMTTPPNIGAPIVMITGDVGHDDLVVDIAATLSAIADNGYLIVDLTDTEHLTEHHLNELLAHTPQRVLIVHPESIGEPGECQRVAPTVREVSRLVHRLPRPHPPGGEPECTS